ncbi:MAG: hypothetical protein JWP81_3026 [Ferruginibacter sp.]|nr:hypothetical protein [Ferruginibacter sp.]
MKRISTLLAAIAIFTSCNTTQYLHQSGTYTIKERNGDVTEFYEVKGRYNVMSDTLKPNDKIVINLIKARPFKQSAKRKRYDFAKNF